MTNFERWIDVHYFDGRCKSCVDEIQNLDTIIVSSYDKQVMAKHFYSVFTNSNAIKALNLIMSGVGNISNRGGAYELDACKLLFICYFNYMKDGKDPTLLNVIQEQLNDMIITHGTCPEGRCTRLLQIAKCFY